MTPEVIARTLGVGPGRARAPASKVEARPGGVAFHPSAGGGGERGSIRVLSSFL